VIEAGDATLDVASIGGGAFGLRRQIADDADALADRGVLKGDAGSADDVDLADSGTVLPCDCSALPAEEDVGNRGAVRGRRRSR
jgi:hypothetical protein